MGRKSQETVNNDSFNVDGIWNISVEWMIKIKTVGELLLCYWIRNIDKLYLWCCWKIVMQSLANCQVPKKARRYT